MMFKIVQVRKTTKPEETQRHKTPLQPGGGGVADQHCWFGGQEYRGKSQVAILKQRCILMAVGRYATIRLIAEGERIGWLSGQYREATERLARHAAEAHRIGEAVDTIGKLVEGQHSPSDVDRLLAVYPLD